MKRIITIIFVLGLESYRRLLSLAGSRPAELGQRSERVSVSQLRQGIPERCLVARVTTKDGDNWATVAFNCDELPVLRTPGVQRSPSSCTALAGPGITSRRVPLGSRVDGPAYRSRSWTTCTCHVVDD